MADASRDQRLTALAGELHAASAPRRRGRHRPVREIEAEIAALIEAEIAALSREHHTPTAPVVAPRPTRSALDQMHVDRYGVLPDRGVVKEDGADHAETEYDPFNRRSS
jgi:hypothetical protein